jgi:RimJ/RimL family protein N-acetyltransferase
MKENTMNWKDINTVTLGSERLTLRPIHADDKAQLGELAKDPAIWAYFVQQIHNEADLEKFMQSALVDLQSGTRVVFTILDRQTGEVLGSMAYGNLSESERRLEIGWSWLGKNYRGTGVNREAKRLLLEHAFDVLECERVEFKTDVLNTQARKGLLNIGATEEGVFRSFNYMPSGRRRDAIYYSILKAEWPSVRDRLEIQAGRAEMRK